MTSSGHYFSLPLLWYFKNNTTIFALKHNSAMVLIYTYFILDSFTTIMFVTHKITHNTSRLLFSLCIAHACYIYTLVVNSSHPDGGGITTSSKNYCSDDIQYTINQLFHLIKSVICHGEIFTQANWFSQAAPCSLKKYCIVHGSTLVLFLPVFYGCHVKWCRKDLKKKKKKKKKTSGLEQKGKSLLDFDFQYLASKINKLIISNLRQSLLFFL